MARRQFQLSRTREVGVEVEDLLGQGRRLQAVVVHHQDHLPGRQG